MANIIELKDIHKSFFGAVETRVIFGIDLAVEEGSLLSIIGQSGSGKSTLMNIIGTLDRPTSGEVYIEGVRTDTLSKDELARLRNETIGFVFQFHYLLPEYTILENVLMPNYIKLGRPPKRELDRAMELLELVDIAEKAGVLANNVSGGQQQRAAIARALMNNPQIILADEPTGNLDSETSARIEQLFCKINMELGNTFIIITHDDRIAKNTDRVVELKDGLIFKDTKNEHVRECIK